VPASIRSQDQNQTSRPATTRRKDHGYAATTAALAVTLTAAPLSALAADRYFDSDLNVNWGSAPYSGFEGGGFPSSDDRAIYSDKGSGQSFVQIATRKAGQLVFLASYTGSGFVSNTPVSGTGTLAIYGIDGLGVDSRANQQIMLNDKVTLEGDQEWRINSETGSIRQLTNASGRGLNLKGFALTLNAVNAGNAFYLDNPISGTGSLTIAGQGSTTLTATNTYSGGTYLNGGTLRVSRDDNLGNAAGALTFNGGVLQITGTAFTSTARQITLGANGGGLDIADAANTLSLAQSISGAGSLTKLGAGALTLSGANSYTGETRIEAGKLVLTGAGSVAASARVLNNGIFDISGTASGASIKSLAGTGTVNLGAQELVLTAASDEFSGALQGSGGLTLKAGAQTLSGTANAAYTGPTTVLGGALTVNGALGNSAVTVHNGGMLAGSGTVGRTEIRSGGVISPGNSIGTLSATATLPRPRAPTIGSNSIPLPVRQPASP